MEPFQFKIGQLWNNTSEARRNSWSDKNFNNFLFIFLDAALLDAKKNHAFGLTTAHGTVIISCGLSKQTCTMDGFEIIHVMKWYYDRRKTNFLKKLKHAGLHVLIPFQLKEVRDILKDPGFEIPENSL